MLQSQMDPVIEQAPKELLENMSKAEVTELIRLLEFRLVKRARNFLAPECAEALKALERSSG